MHRQSTVSIRLIKMKKLFEVITTFLCINFVTPVVMYYIYDDNPTVGFVGVDNVVGEYVANYNAPKKPFTQPYGSRFQKYTNERVVDSHFKLMKSPSRYALPTLMDRNNAQRRNDHRNTVPPKGWQQNNPQPRTTVNRQHQQQQQQPQQQQQQPKQQQINPQTNNSPMAFHNQPAKSSYTMDSRRADSQQHKDINIKDNIIQPLRPQTVNPEYTSPMKQRPRSPDSVYDPKSNFVQVNVRKTQILQDPQKLVRLNNNIQLKAASVLSSQNERQRIPTSMIMDKTLHKSNNGLGDHNLQAMSQVLDDITQQVSDRRHNKRENRIDYKQPSLDVIDKNKRSFVFDSMKKYIGKNKTITKERADRKGIQMARASSNEESLEVNETPYALFYRMNPESVDQQEAVVLLRSMEANGSHDLNSNERRRSNDWNFKNTASKTINNSAKRLHKQMQLLNNFGSQK